MLNLFIHSFILNIYIAPLQENYSEARWWLPPSFCSKPVCICYCSRSIVNFYHHIVYWI